MTPQPFEPHQTATNAVFAFIEGSYNRQRLHPAIGDPSSDAMERIAAAA
jgi:putative transposase